MKFKVLVCGGRDLDEAEGERWLRFNGEAAVARLMRVPLRKVEIETVVQGTARGGDAAGDAWGRAIGAESEAYAPDWNKHGRAAGIIRNGEMLEQSKPHCCIALPGGTGTANMISRCRAAGVPVFEVKFS